MTFARALLVMETGGAIRRPQWAPCLRYALGLGQNSQRCVVSVVDGQEAPVRLDGVDVLADDWEIWRPVQPQQSLSDAAVARVRALVERWDGDAEAWDRCAAAATSHGAHTSAVRESSRANGVRWCAAELRAALAGEGDRS